MKWRVLFTEMKRSFTVHCITRQLIGRDCVKPKELLPAEVRKILWTAFDLKTNLKSNCMEPLNLIRNKIICLIFVKSMTRYQLSLENAIRLLGGSYSTYYDPTWSEQPNLSDNGRLLSRLCDLIILHGMKQLDVYKVADGASIPVFNSCSSHYSILKGLSDLMTFQEQFGYLKGLNFAWVGPPAQIFNTYLYLLPMVGINVKFIGLCYYGSGGISSVDLNKAVSSCKKLKSNLIEASTLEEVVAKADVVGTSAHLKPEFKITFKLLDTKAAVNWYFVHPLPRTEVEVDDEVFYNKRNLVWNSVDNTTYVAMALILHLLKEYKPRIPEPLFDGKENC